MRHYTDWLTGVQDGRYDRTRLTAHQWRQITAGYPAARKTLSRRAYLRGYKRGQRARYAYATHAYTVNA